MWIGHGWGRQWWPAIRTSNGHLGAHLRCTLSSSCHRIALATAPDTPTPQHRFADPQKLAAGFQLAFSRTGPKTVSCSPLLVSRFGGEHNVLSLHTRSPVMSGLHLSTCGRDHVSLLYARALNATLYASAKASGWLVEPIRVVARATVRPP